MENKPKLQTNTIIWDCGSSLYDSFELKSFKNQLDSAISSRCLSMPHIPVEPPRRSPTRKKNFRHLSKSLKKLIRSAVFRVKPILGFKRSHACNYGGNEMYDDGGYEKYSGALTSIPEICEKDVATSPEFSRVVRKTVSERFSSTTVEAW